MKHLPAALLLFLLAGRLCAQSFYVTSSRDNPLGNRAFQLTLGNCDSTHIYSCPPTNDIIEYFENKYTDIAIDKSQRVFCVSAWGSLYMRSLSDSSFCAFLGSFNNAINALVADSAGNIYAAGNQNNKCYLFKYSAGVFSQLGVFPATFFSAGDLFFYESKLYLTGVTSDLVGSYLVEVSLPNPSQSCYFMDLAGIKPYGAFSVRNGGASRAFIIAYNNVSSTLHELDMAGRSLGNTLCTYPFLIDGAAQYYDMTASTTLPDCARTNGLDELSQGAWFFRAENPAGQELVLHTNMNLAQLRELTLADVSGKQVKRFEQHELRSRLPLTGLAPGLYLLQVRSAGGDVFQQKLVKNGE